MMLESRGVVKPIGPGTWTLHKAKDSGIPYIEKVDDDGKTVRKWCMQVFQEAETVDDAMPATAPLPSLNLDAIEEETPANPPLTLPPAPMPGLGSGGLLANLICFFQDEFKVTDFEVQIIC